MVTCKGENRVKTFKTVLYNIWRNGRFSSVTSFDKNE